MAIDLVIHDFLQDRLAELKADPSLLNLILEGYPQERIEQVKTYILQNDIKIVYHHPRDETELPCYAIVLESSVESEQVIGMSGDLYSEVLVSSMEDGWIGSDSDILRENTLLPRDVKQYYSALEFVNGRRSCRLYGKQGVSKDKGIWIDFTNSVLEGGHVSLVDMGNLVFLIKSRDRTGSFLELGFGKKAHREHVFPVSLHYQNVWERVVVDIKRVINRNKDAIRYMSFTISDDSSVTDIYIDSLKGEKAEGIIWEEAFFDHAYRIESWSNNADLSVFLYDVLKWYLLRYRTYLETSWGYIQQRITGADLMPQPEWYPEFVYVRALTYNMKTIEAIPRETDLSTFDIRVGRMDMSNGV